mmetsp:Transcript_27775/g.85195  ORF Transcript_27775/g.85195 Transcript_27775/m.85195 type:complete len:231 (-) Transcript_27775:247-939(-)
MAHGGGERPLPRTPLLYRETGCCAAAARLPSGFSRRASRRCCARRCRCSSSWRANCGANGDGAKGDGAKGDASAPSVEKFRNRDDSSNNWNPSDTDRDPSVGTGCAGGGCCASPGPDTDCCSTGGTDGCAGCATGGGCVGAVSGLARLGSVGLCCRASAGGAPPLACWLSCCCCICNCATSGGLARAAAMAWAAASCSLRSFSFSRCLRSFLFLITSLRSTAAKAWGSSA